MKEQKEVTAFDEVFKKIREDKELYYAYQSNIAMAFKDEYHRARKDKAYIGSIAIHEIANKAAKNFLNLLIEPKV